VFATVSLNGAGILKVNSNGTVEIPQLAASRLAANAVRANARNNVIGARFFIDLTRKR